MSSVQNQIQNQGVSQSILDALRREAYEEIVKKARDRGYRYLTPYEFWRLRRFIEYHLDALLPRPQYTPPEGAEIPNRCFLVHDNGSGWVYDAFFNYIKYRVCGDDRLLGGNYCCIQLGGIADVTNYALDVLSKLVVWPRRRYNYYSIGIRPHDDDVPYFTIEISDNDPRRAVIYTLSELIALGYYTPPILT